MKITDSIHSSWHSCIVPQLYREPLHTLNTKILPNISYQPRPENIFRAFEMPLQNVKVVIIGQDPYPLPDDAIGYAFATRENRKTPGSLRVIEKEICQTDGINLLHEGTDEIHSSWKTLSHWTNQGVLLLNTALTVQTSRAGSHLKYWKNFTARIISYISINQPCIWIFWGKKAQWFIPCLQREPFHVRGYSRNTIEDIPIDDYNYILTAPHPATELYNNGNGGYYGCDHFYFVNKILALKGQKNIIW